MTKLGHAFQSELDAHVSDASAAHAATAISFTPAGTIAATTVQAAIEEVAAEAGGATAVAPSWVPIPVFDLAGNAAPGTGTMESTVAIVRQPITANRIVFHVAVSSGNIDVGIYDDDGLGGAGQPNAPGTLLVSSGSVACPAEGAASVTIAGTALTPGRYWVGICPDNNTAQFRYGTDRAGLRATFPLRYGRSGTFPLPSPGNGGSPGGDENVYFITMAQV